jgi:hypothetical protein
LTRRAAVAIYTVIDTDLDTAEAVMAFHVRDPATDLAVRQLAS